MICYPIWAGALMPWRASGDRKKVIHYNHCKGQSASSF
ncbi:hypothetical protein O53_3397 [Microcystis aeruginosa TAIHU98]|uniref:Uncharacterized protein n=2 Tax=Microcystis aeruginosa TaxID=1126 RepID=A0A0A1W122_MICAE|nr:hypothetical protein O53_3397 [Microcystis aeruginosa TAIHU98]ODV37008.1 hypothetical protein BFG60_3496 [Microcystis aeruginosa NIES-98]GAL95690.1 hypothetical protein N44_04546 [Microcystis aeruginosa NIES-44]